MPEGFVADATDCDDTETTVHPSAGETCNELDDNCNGETDEGERIYLMADHDGDGYGVLNADDTLIGCVPPEGFTTLEGDCNDGDGAVHPTATELCNLIDDDCNHYVDDGDVCDTPATCPANDLYEPNGTIATAAAVAIVAGTTLIQQGISCSAGGGPDEDWYAFQVLAGDVLTIANPDAAKLAVTLFKTQNEALSSATDTTPIAHVAGADGTVYLQVRSVASADVPYTLDVRLARCGGCDGFSYCEVDTCLPGCGFDSQCGELERCEASTHACITTDCRLIQCEGLQYCDGDSGHCLAGCAYDLQCTGDDRCNEATHTCEFPGFVAAVRPDDGEDVVAVGTDVTVEFGSAMDRTATADAFHIELAGADVTGVLNWDNDSKGFRFTPDAFLSPCQTYDARLDASAATAAGDLLGAAYTWHFETACQTLTFEQKQAAMAAISEEVAARDSNGPYSTQTKQSVVAYALAEQGDYFARGGVRTDGTIELTFLDGGLYTMSFEYVETPAPGTTSTAKRSADAPAAASSTSSPTSSASAAPGLPASRRAVLMEGFLGYLGGADTDPTDTIEPMLDAAGYDASTQSLTVSNLLQLGLEGPIGVLYIGGHGVTADWGEWCFSTSDTALGFNATLETMEKQGYIYKGDHVVKFYWFDLTTMSLAYGPILPSIPGWTVREKLMVEYVYPHLAPNAIVATKTCNSYGLNNAIKRNFADKNLTTAVTVGTIDGSRMGPLLTLFNWLLGADDYTQQPVARPTYAVRPFRAQAVGTALSSNVDTNGVALNSLGTSAFQLVTGDGMLAPSIRNVEFDTTDPVHVRVVAYGQFGTTAVADLVATLDGAEKPVIVDQSELACAPGTSGDCAKVAVDLGSDPCGSFQIRVRGVKSNVVPLTCWTGSLSLVSDISPTSCIHDSTAESAWSDAGASHAETHVVTVSPDPLPLTIECELTFVADARAYRTSGPASAPDPVVARTAAAIPAADGCKYSVDGTSWVYQTTQSATEYASTGEVEMTFYERTDSYRYVGSGTLPNTAFGFEFDLPSDPSDGVVRAFMDPIVVPLQWSYDVACRCECRGCDGCETVHCPNASTQGTVDEPLSAYEVYPVPLPNDQRLAHYLSPTISIGITGPQCASSTSDLVLAPRAMPYFDTRR